MKQMTIAVVLSLSAGFAHAQDADVGKDLFGNNCAICHGVNADGQGPLTQYLNVAAPPLTGLAAAQSDGQFPMLRVIHVIDGRTGLRTHETAMPTFGEAFSIEAARNNRGDWGSVLEARGKIMSIALYLESIQK